jgi:hypothetical protein
LSRSRLSVSRTAAVQSEAEISYLLYHYPAAAVRNLRQIAGADGDATATSATNKGRMHSFHVAQSMYWKQFKEICTDGQGLTLQLSKFKQCSAA